MIEAQHAWVDGYAPGDPWRASLRMRSAAGTVSYPLTPNTIPELLEQLVLVAQEQQGIEAGIPDEPEEPAAAGDRRGEEPETAEPARGTRLARLSGWELVHGLWERDDPTARIIMFAAIAALVLIGSLLA